MASDTDMFRIPPQSIPAEACVIGSMLYRPEALQEAVADVKPEWFYRPAHRIMFERLVRMAADSVDIDALTVKQALIDAGEYQRIGGDEYYQDLLSGVPDARHIAQYAKILRDKATKRALIEAGNQMVSQGYDATIPATEAVGNACAAIHSVGDSQATRRRISVGDAMSGVLQHGQDVREGKIPPALPTGFPNLDKRLTGGGIRPGQLILIAARPGIGKSLVAGDMARSIVQCGGGVLFVSGEMSSQEIMERHAAAMSNIIAAKLAGGRCSGDEVRRLEQVQQETAGWRMQIIDEAKPIAEIAAVAKRLDGEWDGGLSAVFVDYLGLMTPDRRDTNREQEVGGMARQCKQAAAQTGVPWVILHQLNRAGATGRPELHHMRDSGQLEEHANTCLLLDWSSGELQGDQWSNGGAWRELMIRIAKQRGGLVTSWENSVRRKLRGAVTRTEAMAQL
jgi:replicative DNA helicase